MNFFLKISLFAFIILILFFILISIQFYYSNVDSVEYPPIKNICPDYWKVSNDKYTCIVPTESKLTGTLKIKPNYPIYKDNTDQKLHADFTHYIPDKNLSKLCNLKQWANHNNIVWNGISNNNKC